MLAPAGIRAALGAQAGDAIRHVPGGGPRLVCAGVVAGLAASAVLTRSLESVLYGVEPAGALTFAAAADPLAALSHA